MADVEHPDELERDALARSCNQKERAFCEQYIIDLNGTQSVLRAGCFNISTIESANNAASRLLSRPKVNALIAIMIAQRASRVGTTQESVLHELSLLANSSHDWFVVDDNGQVKTVEGAPEGAIRAIESIKRKKTIREDREGNVFITYDVQIKLWDKPGAIKLQGKHAGLFADKVEVGGLGGKPIEIITKIERVIVKPTQS